VARALIVGCGCRGQSLARALAADGIAVRGTTRRAEATAAIEAAGAEAVVADPDRLATLVPQLAGVTVVCWLLGSAHEPSLHGERLETMLEHIVDTPVRGLVYEAAGSVPFEWRQQGEMIVRGARATWNIPLEVLHADPFRCDVWRAEAVEAVARLLGETSR
jgi:uncharacterized protein YbjT (DUF2867 family)